MPRGACPGENRFAAKKEAMIRNTVTEIETVLDVVRPRHVTFPNITQLSKYVAEVINERRRTTEGDAARPINPSTLRRQPRYRVKLDAFLAEPKANHDAEFKKLATGLDSMEVEAIRAENARLKAYIEKSLASPLEEGTPPIRQHTRPAVVDDLCRAIALLVEASDGQFVVDPETGEIVKSWARSKRNRTVVSSAIAKPYIEWSKSIPALGDGEDADEER